MKQNIKLIIEVWPIVSQEDQPSNLWELDSWQLLRHRLLPDLLLPDNSKRKASACCGFGKCDFSLVQTFKPNLDKHQCHRFDTPWKSFKICKLWRCHTLSIFCIFRENRDNTVEAVQRMAFSWAFISSFASFTSSFASFTSSFASFTSSFASFTSCFASFTFCSSPVSLAVRKSSTAMSNCFCAVVCWFTASCSWRRAKVKASTCHRCS